MRKANLAVLLWLSLACLIQAAELEPADIGQFCVTPGRPAVLQWRADGDALEPPLEAVVRNYMGEVVQSPSADVDRDGILQLTLRFEPGFYEIDFPAAGKRFGVICQPAYEGRPDPFFAIDSAMSWLVRDDSTRAGLAGILARCGIPMSRERLNWADVNPARDEWNWESPRRYETLRNRYRREGVEVLEMFHSSTQWAGRVGKYPEDLVGTARAWRKIADRYGPAWGALEVWNEPDISFGDYLPADQYVALVKTFAYAFESHGVEAPLVGGVFAHDNEKYLESAARNGLLDCVPVVSFHTYSRAPAMEELIGRYRRWLADHGRAATPLWLTECGRPWKRGPARPPRDQDAESALDIVMKGVESKACGISRYFSFVYPYYEERESNFGMMGRRATPLRSMAAYVQMVQALSHKSYLGDLDCGDASVRRARVFGGADETIAVLYTGNPDAGAAIRLDFPVEAALGIDGRRLTKAAAGTIPVPDGLVYLRVDRTQLGRRLQTDTRAMELLSYTAQPAPDPEPASPIVLRYQFDPERIAPKSEEYRLLAETPGTTPFVFRVFNLSGRPERRSLTLSFSQPVAFADRPTQNVTIPAASHSDVRWNVDLAGAFAATGTLRAVLRAEANEDRGAEKLEIDLAGNPTLPQVLRRYSHQRPLPVGDLAAWRANITGTGEMAMEAPEEGGWRLSCRFEGGDRWVYPIFTLPEDVAVDRYGALVLRARCRGEASVRIFLWEGDTGVGYLSPAVIPADGNWHTAAVPFRDFFLSGANQPDPNGRLDLDRVRRISIGMNSEVDENELEVGAVYFVED